MKQVFLLSLLLISFFLSFRRIKGIIMIILPDGFYGY